MKLLIAEAEYTFNETSMNVSSFISIASNEAAASVKDEEKLKKEPTEIHIS